MLGRERAAGRRLLGRPGEAGQALILMLVAITAAAVVTAMTGGLEKMSTGIKDCIDFKSNTVCTPF